MDDIKTLTLKQMSEGIRNKQFTSKQLTVAFLDRIEAVNPATNAVINLAAEQALKYSERADFALAGGETPGKLFGIPMTIKDSLDTFDLVSTWGTLGRADFRPGSDATCVKRLRDEGAILMGKTNTPEFTLSFKTDNLLFGKTRNPFDLSRTPGGSSGGAAAALACDMTPFDVGTDTGGSIRVPAHFSGVCGIKPTTGRIPCTGNALPSSGILAPLSQPGPMARSVEDLIYLLDIMQGPDNIDPHAVSAENRDPYKVDVDQLRIGFHSDNGIKTPEPDIQATIHRVVDLLKDQNHHVTDVRPIGLEMAGFLYGRLFAADNADIASMLLEDCGTSTPSPVVASIIKSRTPDSSAQEFSRVVHLWHNYQSTMLAYFNDFDILITPVNASCAIGHDEPEDFAAFTYTSAYNLTGWPGVVIPAGTNKDGLPIGIQILARPFREDHCLALAHYLEAHLGTFPKPSLDHH